MKLSTPELLKVLQDMREAIVRNDSYEGSIKYSALEDGLKPNEWEVSYIYRVGNADGQGGMRIALPSPQPQDEHQDAGPTP